jgi:hypothetical protein
LELFDLKREAAEEEPEGSVRDLDAGQRSQLRRLDADAVSSIWKEIELPAWAELVAIAGGNIKLLHEPPEAAGELAVDPMPGQGGSVMRVPTRRLHGALRHGDSSLPPLPGVRFRAKPGRLR